MTGKTLNSIALNGKHGEYNTRDKQAKGQNEKNKGY